MTSNAGFPIDLNSHRLFTLIAMCLFILANISSQAWSGGKRKLVINSGGNEPYVSSDGTGFYRLIVNEIFSRLDIDVEFVPLPNQRSLISANDGVDDGNMARIEGLEKKYPNLIRVPEKIIDYQFVAYSLDGNIRLSGWASLEPYQVAYINGWQIFEKNLGDTKNVTRVRKPAQLYSLLQGKRVDIILFERWSGLYWSQHLNVEARLLQPPLATRALYMYLHKKHADLVPAVAQALVDMKKDGTYQRIFDKKLAVLAE